MGAAGPGVGGAVERPSVPIVRGETKEVRALLPSTYLDACPQVGRCRAKGRLDEDLSVVP